MLAACRSYSIKLLHEVYNISWSTMLLKSLIKYIILSWKKRKSQSITLTTWAFFFMLQEITKQIKNVFYTKRLRRHFWKKKHRIFRQVENFHVRRHFSLLFFALKKEKKIQFYLQKKPLIEKFSLRCYKKCKQSF